MIVPVHDEHNKDEESPAEYNQGGYLVVRVGDTFKDGRYVVTRKLGYVTYQQNLPACAHVMQLGSFLYGMARQGHSVSKPAIFGHFYNAIMMAVTVTTATPPSKSSNRPLGTPKQPKTKLSFSRRS
jgi:hypothetical protein